MLDSYKINFHKIFVALFAIYFIITPLGIVNLGILGSALRFYALFLIPIALLAQNIKKIRITNICLWQFILVFWGFFSLLYGIDFEKTIAFFITQLMFFILLILSANINYNDTDLKLIKKCLIWSSRIMVIILLIFGEHIESRLLLSGLFQEDPNNFNGYLLFGLINALETILSDKSLKIKAFYGFEMCIYIYISLLTGSRGGLFGLLVGLFFFMAFTIIKQINNKKVFSHIFQIILTLSLIMVFIFNVIDLFELNLAKRFYLTNILEGNATGRFDIWEEALYLYFNSGYFEMLFGYGAGSFIDIISSFSTGIFHVAHNVFIQILIELGLIGLLIYVMLIFSFLKKSIKINNIFILSVLIGFIFMSFSLSIFALKPYWNAIIYCNIAFITFENGSNNNNRI